MLEIEEEKKALMKYLKCKTFKKRNVGILTREECWEISVNPDHCYPLLKSLSKAGYFTINEMSYYIDSENYVGDRFPECKNGEEADCFDLEKSLTVDFPHDITCDTNIDTNQLIRLDDNRNIIWNDKLVVFPGRTNSESPKYQLVIKQIIENCPKGGSTTYPIIAKQINDKTKGGVSSHQIREFFRRAKIDKKLILNATKVNGNEIKIFETSAKLSGRLTVTFNNKSDDR